MVTNIEFDKAIDSTDMDGIDNIIESDEPTTGGVINIDDIDSTDDDDYVPVTSKPIEEDDEKVQKIIAEKMQYVAQRDTGHFAEERKRITEEINAYKKDLMISKGFTFEEAEAAASKRAEKLATEANNAYAEEHPEIAVIKVNKADADKIEIAPEDKPKIHKSNLIRLIEVEDKELKHIKIKRRDDKVPFNVAQLNTCILAKQAVPCINTGDICYFTGTTSYSLVSLFFEEEENAYQRLSKQVALAYEKFISSTTKSKYTTSGEIAMTQEDFANWFLYPDLAAALYAIYVASSTEMLTSPFECSTCKDVDTEHPGKMKKHTFNYTYNCKELMDFSEISETYQKALDDIRANEGDRDGMLKLQETINQGHRYKSPITNNIYDIQVPSCARALAFAKYIKAGDRLTDTFANVAMYITSAYIYCGMEDGEPVYTLIDSIEDIYAMVSNAIEPEFQFYYKKLIDEKAYTYNFKLTYKCDKCGHEVTSDIDVASLIFLKAQGSEAEIE